MDLAANITALRIDLADAAEAIWDDTELARHIAHALADYSRARPRRYFGAGTITPDSRDVPLSGQSTAETIEHIEYPVGEVPRSFVEFDEEMTNGTRRATLHISHAPTTSEDRTVRVYYRLPHTIEDLDSATETTLRSTEEAIVLTGAAGYALSSIAIAKVNAINAGGRNVAAEYAERGAARLSDFRKQLQPRTASGGTLQTPDLV